MNFKKNEATTRMNTEAIHAPAAPERNEICGAASKDKRRKL